MISTDVLQKIYSKCSDNREFLTVIEYINGDNKNISQILTLIGI